MIDEDSAALDIVIERVVGSRKYRTVTRHLVAEVAATQAAKARTVEDHVKRVKRQLHQLCGAYLEGRYQGEQWSRELAEAAAVGGSPLRDVAGRMMAAHASTRERLPVLERFYTTIFARLPPPRTVMDIGCGLNPLAIPWMPLPPGARYWACDADAAVVDVVACSLPHLPVAVTVEVRDVVSQPPDLVADVALVLKLIPLLDRLQPGGGQALLCRLRARHLVVSFASASLSGRKRGIDLQHERGLLGLVTRMGWQAQQLRLGNELVFLVDTGART